MNESKIPWTVRYSMARYEQGLPVVPHLLLAVQMSYFAGGCPSH
jgi:hypothetical protein